MAGIKIADYPASVLAVLALMASPTALAQPASPIVATADGQVRGSVQDGVLQWKGIPFAAAPVGDNRWREPQPMAPWTNVRDTTDFGHDCMQTPFPGDAAPIRTKPAEDCLYLNVWRPAQAPAHAKLPVMVWIYGGGFNLGGSSPATYSGEGFAKRGVLFVSFNYRLGRFGFFSHPALSAAHQGLVGNFGYMDQIAALKWVQRNIAGFGGDPDNVTVLGESAGGASTLMVLSSPQTRGLFARAIVMSGGGRGSLLPARDVSRDLPGLASGDTVGVAFAHSVGIEGTGADALAALRALPAEKLLSALSFGAKDAVVTYAGGPMHDGVIVPAEADALIREGKTPAVPVMIGTTSADIGLPSAVTRATLYQPFGAHAGAAQHAYDPNLRGDTYFIAAAIAADQMMGEPARHIAGLVAKRGQPAYYYRFGYVANDMKKRYKTGASHASDIPWAFDTITAKYGDKVTSQDRGVAHIWNSYFTNFAKTGNPNGPGLAKWLPYTRANDSLMDITANGAAVNGPDPWKKRLDLAAARAGEPVRIMDMPLVTAAATSHAGLSHYTTSDTSIGTLLTDPAARAVVDKHLPGISKFPFITALYSFTFQGVVGLIPTINDKVLEAVDADLAQLPPGY